MRFAGHLGNDQPNPSGANIKLLDHQVQARSLTFIAPLSCVCKFAFFVGFLVLLVIVR